MESKNQEGGLTTWQTIIIIVVVIILIVIIAFVITDIFRKPTGACCDSSGSCTIKESTLCTFPSVYYGDNSTCTSNLCSTPPPGSGACCNNGTCSQVTEPNCIGIFKGENTLCSTNPCDITDYILDLAAISTSQNDCPSGYSPIGFNPPSNGNLKQGTGNGTPNIWLCKSTTTDPSRALTDIIVFQNGTPGASCPSGNETTYKYHGSTEYDFEKGCNTFGRESPYTKICRVGPVEGGTPIQDIVVVASNSDSPSCPSGYKLATVSNNFIGGVPGNLNRECGGPTIKLCVKQ